MCVIISIRLSACVAISTILTIVCVVMSRCLTNVCVVMSVRLIKIFKIFDPKCVSWSLSVCTMCRVFCLSAHKCRVFCPSATWKGQQRVRGGLRPRHQKTWWRSDGSTDDHSDSKKGYHWETMNGKKRTDDSNDEQMWGEGFSEAQERLYGLSWNFGVLNDQVRNVARRD